VPWVMRSLRNEKVRGSSLSSTGNLQFTI
jgi:hypothetical protein